MIKHFLKIFFTSIFLFVILGTVIVGCIVINDEDIVIGRIENIEIQPKNKLALYESSTFDYDENFGKLIKNSKRLNVLVVGLEGVRTDTIMLVSYDVKTKATDIISIPRDTYYPILESTRADNKKINAIYASKGIKTLMLAVEDITGMPVDKYVIFNYDAVISCIDIIGGVEVNVPFHMQYSDPYDDPPLVIDIKEGLQVLNGEESLKFLRFRKGYANQDLGRIQAQQEFIRSAAKKALGFKLPSLVKELYSSVKTNLNLVNLLEIASGLDGFSSDNINMSTLPGDEAKLEGLSFYMLNNDEIQRLVYDIYGINEKNKVVKGNE